MTFRLKALSILVVATLAQPALATTRSCNAFYSWETTGGTYSNTFEDFSASGTCGVNGNDCRRNARRTAERCIGTQWDKRWDHHKFKTDGTLNEGQIKGPPEACLSAARVNNYDLSKICVKKRIDGEDPVSGAVCDTRAKSNNIKVSVRSSHRGDFKAALEADVCCFKEDGLEAFQDDEQVFVRVFARINSGNDQQNICSKTIPLSDNYEINCARVRRNLCGE